VELTPKFDGRLPDPIDRYEDGIDPRSAESTVTSAESTVTDTVSTVTRSTATCRDRPPRTRIPLPGSAGT